MSDVQSPVKVADVRIGTDMRGSIELKVTISNSGDKTIKLSHLCFVQTDKNDKTGELYVSANVPGSLQPSAKMIFERRFPMKDLKSVHFGGVFHRSGEFKQFVDNRLAPFYTINNKEFYTLREHEYEIDGVWKKDYFYDKIRLINSVCLGISYLYPLDGGVVQPLFGKPVWEKKSWCYNFKLPTKEELIKHFINRWIKNNYYITPPNSDGYKAVLPITLIP